MSNGLDKNGFSSINSNKTYSNKHSNKGEEDKTCSPELAEALNAFAEHRKKLKKPMTDRAKELLLSNLSKMASTEQEQIAILNQSIVNGWQGVFPLKQKQGRQSATDMADDVIRMMDERGMLDDTRGANENDTNAGGVPSWFSE
jgi:hypothetical protein